MKSMKSKSLQCGCCVRVNCSWANVLILKLHFCIVYNTIIDYCTIAYDMISTSGYRRGQYWYSVVNINVTSNSAIVNNCFIIFHDDNKNIDH